MHFYLNILHCVVLIVTFDNYTIISNFFFFFSLKKSNYEELIVDMIKRALILDHSKSPCEENFIPDMKVTVFISVFRAPTKYFYYVLRHYILILLSENT